MPLLRSASRHELSLIRFPDPRTTWVVVMRAHLSDELPPVAHLQARLDLLASSVPLVAARLRGEEWHTTEPLTGPAPIVTALDPLEDPRLAAPFDLAHEAPLRVLLGPGRTLGLAAHHAAFDGLAMVALLDNLLGGPAPRPIESPPAGEADGMGPYLARLARPADRVAPSATPCDRDAFASVPIEVSGREVTARIAAACVAACGRFTISRQQAWSKIGITLAVGGPAGVGNVAGFRRIDLTPDAPVVPAAVAALATPQEPSMQVRSPRTIKLLQPVVNRFSDTILVSNLGRHAITGVDRLDFFAVARGRSAVVFGAAGVEGGVTTLSIRARDLSQADAEAILADAADRFASTRGEPPVLLPVPTA